MNAHRGLSDIASATLEQLLNVLERRLGDHRVAPTDLSSLREEDRVAIESLALNDIHSLSAALRVAIAERAHRPPPGLHLVWTGPEPKVSTARGTSSVVQELFAGALHSVLVAGYRFDHGDAILRPLHESMVARGTTVKMYLDTRERLPDGGNRQEFARRFVEAFLRENWPFGPPFPSFFIDPRTVDGDVYASLHAKCIVADGRRTLVTSANFTDRAQSRNIEVGVLVDDSAFATELLGQWQGAVDAGIFVRVVA